MTATTTASTNTAEPGPLAKARELREYIRSLAPVIEEERQLPKELIDRLRQSGLMHLLVPRSRGGAEEHPVTAAQVVEELSYADGSTGWCAMLAPPGIFVRCGDPRGARNRNLGERQHRRRECAAHREGDCDERPGAGLHH